MTLEQEIKLLKEEITSLKSRIESFGDVMGAGRYGIRELERLAKEIGKHQDKLIKRYVNGEEK